MAGSRCRPVTTNTNIRSGLGICCPYVTCDVGCIQVIGTNGCASDCDCTIPATTFSQISTDGPPVTIRPSTTAELRTLSLPGARMSNSTQTPALQPVTDTASADTTNAILIVVVVTLGVASAVLLVLVVRRNRRTADAATATTEPLQAGSAENNSTESDNVARSASASVDHARGQTIAADGVAETSLTASPPKTLIFTEDGFTFGRGRQVPLGASTTRSAAATNLTNSATGVDAPWIPEWYHNPDDTEC